MYYGSCLPQPLRQQHWTLLEFWETCLLIRSKTSGKIVGFFFQCCSARLFGSEEPNKWRKKPQQRSATDAMCMHHAAGFFVCVGERPDRKRSAAPRLRVIFEHYFFSAVAQFKSRQRRRHVTNDLQVGRCPGQICKIQLLSCSGKCIEPCMPPPGDDRLIYVCETFCGGFSSAVQPSISSPSAQT